MQSNESQNLFVRNAQGTRDILKNKTVLVLGLGGIGANTAIGLARSGVGHLILVDFDHVEPSNLNRQQYFFDQIGMNKTEALKTNIERMGIGTKINTENIKVDRENIGSLIEKADLVCECFDNAMAKAMAAEETLILGKPVVATSGMAGIGTSNSIHTERKLPGLYLCGDGVSDYRQVDGMMAAGTLVCSGHQVDTAVCLLTGKILK